MKERDIRVTKTESPKTTEDGRMLDEGGLGAEKFYEASNKGVLPLHRTLNEIVANQSVLYMKIHQFHWYVKGPHFYTLHEKFEELYEQATVYMDDFAERLLAKDQRPISTLQESLDLATVKESPYETKMTSDEMVTSLIHDFGIITDIAKKGIHEAQNVGDNVTEDMLIDFVNYMDMTTWMLKSYISS